jgi:hypothetical protein
LIVVAAVLLWPVTDADHLTSQRRRLSTLLRRFDRPVAVAQEQRS